MNERANSQEPSVESLNGNGVRVARPWRSPLDSRHFSRPWLAIFLAGTVAACRCQAESPVRPAGTGPAKVEVRHLDSHWQLYVNGRPFFIKGAGLEFGNQEELAAAGGNSFRTWSTWNGRETGQQILDRAFTNGLFVTMGLDVMPERHGFDYSDTNAVARQFADIRSQVLRYKGHPALLMWDIGNELNFQSHNPRVWDAVNEISRMIHQVDPNHPTTTSLAGIGSGLVDEIKRRAPDLDLLSVQSYSDIVNLPRELRQSGWNGPYMVTEWGATGHWECSKTAWGAPIEDDSSVKAHLYFQRYQSAIAADQKQCLGSYVFLWGQKQERTPTWYGMFLKNGDRTAAVDVMQYLWTGRWPQCRCPELKGFWLDGKNAGQNVRLDPGRSYATKVLAVPSNHEPLSYTWNILEESKAQSSGGDFETSLRNLSGLVTQTSSGEAQVKAPSNPGAYRLYVYAFDNKGHAAYANIPFYVSKATESGNVAAAADSDLSRDRH